MLIRHMNSNDDIYEISNVYEKSWKYAYKGIIPQSYLDSIQEGRWAEAVNKPGMTSLIMLDGERIVAASSYCRSRFADMPDHGEIVSIYFLPEYIGRGYGKELLNAAVEELRKLGFESIFLWALEENERARRFYEKNGFRFSGRYLEDNIGGKALREMQYILHD